MSAMPWGLTAKTTASGASAASSSPADRCAATCGAAASAAGAPAGSTTTKRAAAPLVSQPRSIAEPIWPQPTRTTVPALIGGSLGSGFADRVDHRGGHRLVGRLAAPHHKLERRIEALAFGHRDIDQIFDLLARHRRQTAHQHRIA